jgi:LysR family transcriptional regulator, glycine cleavage system transcriptional activator
MKKRLPPLNPLRAFEATARHGSLTLAAAELNVTHGAVSHQIRTLELTLKVKLFQRVGRRLKLTPNGAELLPAVSSAFDGIAAAAARLTRPATSGELAVSCVPAVLSLWLIPRLRSFLARYPEVRLRLIGSNDRGDLRSPDIDICFHYSDGDWRDCWYRKWSDVLLFPVVSPTLINERPIHSTRDLAGHVLLHGDDGREWQTWLAAADSLRLSPTNQHRFSDARLATEAALNGHGVALGDTVTASGFLANGRLVAPFKLSVPAVEAFYVACRNEVKSVPVAAAFIDWLFDESADLPPGKPTRPRPVPDEAALAAGAALSGRGSG